MVDVVPKARNAAQGGKKLDRLARFGLATRGTLYLLIGWLAFLVAQGHSNQEADQRGALHMVARQTGGIVLLCVIALGLAGYALWRFSEAAYGVAGKRDEKLPRAQSLVRGAVYAFFAYNCVYLIVSTERGSQARQTQLITEDVLHSTGGRWLVGAAGVAVVAVACFLLHEAVTRKFRERLKGWEMSPNVYRVVVWLGVVGTAARAVVFGVAGGLVVDAAVSYNPSKARGLDGALRSLAHSSLGPLLLIAAAIGLVIFGIFGVAEARWSKT